MVQLLRATSQSDSKGKEVVQLHSKRTVLDAAGRASPLIRLIINDEEITPRPEYPVEPDVTR
jgi:hypothetical protein